MTGRVRGDNFYHGGALSFEGFNPQNKQHSAFSVIIPPLPGYTHQYTVSSNTSRIPKPLLPMLLTFLCANQPRNRRAAVSGHETHDAGERIHIILWKLIETKMKRIPRYIAAGSTNRKFKEPITTPHRTHDHRRLYDYLSSWIGV